MSDQCFLIILIDNNMHRIRFQISIYSSLLLLISILMLVLLITLFNGFRFTQCSSWNQLPSAPENTSEILGAVKNTPFLRTNTGQIFCLNDQEWSTCITPAYSFEIDTAPFWSIKMLSQNLKSGHIKQVIRSNGYLKTNYYTLLTNGEIYHCSTSIEDEINQVLSSPQLFVILIPTLGFGLSLAFFIKSFLREGDPTFWDFWGRGKKIK